MRVSINESTSGNGHWSNVIREVRINRLEITYVNDEGTHGEVRAYFTKSSWDVEKHGLIYTDPKFMREFRKRLSEIGLPGNSVAYSEQGMQGTDYVSLDCNKQFITAWEKLGEQVSNDHRLPVKIKHIKPYPTVKVNDPIDGIMKMIQKLSDEDRLRLVSRMFF